MTQKDVKKYFWLMVKICLAILAFWYLFHTGRLTKRNIASLFTIHNIPYIILTGLLICCNQFLTTARLVLLLRAVNITIPFFRCLKLNFIGFFFNVMIPGMTGGDIIKGFYLLKAEESNKGRSSGIVILDRVMGLFANMFIAGISALYLLNHADNAFTRYSDVLYVLSAIGMLLCLLFAAFLILGTRQRIRDHLKNFLGLIFRKTILYHIAEGLGGSVKNRKILLQAFVISIMIQIITLTGLLFLGSMASGKLQNIIALAFVSSLVIFFAAIPITPGNIGWTEFLGSLGWSAIGSGMGGAVFLYWRIIGIFCSLPGGLFYVSLSHADKLLFSEPKNPVNEPWVQ